MAKWGESHLGANGPPGTQGAAQRRNPSKESVADTEIGLYGTATQLEVNQESGNMLGDSEQEAVSLVDLRAKGQEIQQAEHNQGKDGPDLERQHGRGV